MITTMKELAAYINEASEWPLDAEDIIEANGWVSDTHISHRVCHNETERVVLDDLEAVAIPLHIRAGVIAYIDGQDDDYFADIIIRTHNHTTHELIEVSPDGRVYSTSHADNQSQNFVRYPDIPTACIYDICKESPEACDCDVCRIYRDLNMMTEDEFCEDYGYDQFDYFAKDTYREAALLEQSYDNGYYESDVKREMIDAVRAIPYGYFDDEN